MEVGSQKPGRWVLRGASALAVASAVSAAAAADGPRAAVLLPPRVGDPAPAAVVARGAMDDNPLATTPVVRKGAPRPLTPAAKAVPATDWLSGVDPNVIPAAAKGVTPAKMTLDPRPAAGSPKLAPPPPLFAPGEPNPLTKGVESFKGLMSPEGVSVLPPAGSPPDLRSPRDALQGTTPNGAPVLAGPPAWRWYGYGSVTPGASAYAPGGQYPRASANWYSVTKATPGAFPVPVVAPFRGNPGAEPPSYAAAPAPVRPSFTPMMQDVTALPPPPRLTPPPALMPTVEPRAAAPLPVPTMPSLAAATPVSVVPPPFTPIPLPPPPILKAPEPVAAGRPAPPPILPPLSVMPVTPPPAAVPSLVPTVPTVAPVSAPAAAEDDVRWKSNPTHRPTPPPGTWVRPAGQPGASAEPRLPVARGQIGDDIQEPTDPVEAVVQAVCRGRATGVDVRHTGPLQVTVCFEARTQTDATALVRDLSARPELARYEVNFCVLVK